MAAKMDSRNQFIRADIDSTRRILISMAGLVVPMAACLVKSPVLFAAESAPGHNKNHNNIHSGSLKYNFSFAEKSGVGPHVSPQLIEQHLYPLHNEQFLASADFDSRYNVKSVLKNQFINAGYQWKDDYEIEVTSQHYGVPIENYHALELLDYCLAVQRYLYDRLEGLISLELKWQVLRPGENSQLALNSRFRGIVGKYTYRILRVYVKGFDYAGNNSAPYLISAEPLDRAINYITSKGINSDSSSQPSRGLIYIIPGATSLVSPFSEILHLSLHAPSINYEKELLGTHPRNTAHELAISAGETVNEAAAIVMAKQFLNELGESSRLKSINRVADSMSRKFPRISKAIDFMNRNGVQLALNLYIESPSRMMRLI